jgi:peptidoglycan/LPS O-acetylase OafA/YrhL
MRYRPDIDGLRAFAVMAVVLFHAGLDAVPGGFVGVDIFFVISGYLITNLLLREHERTSTINLREFYIRRAFRIFPAAFLFLAVVIVLYWRDMHWYHIASAVFYVANMDITRPWIFGHLWSLSIEEQFYLLWPLAMKKWHRHKVAILICVFLATPVFRTRFAAQWLLETKEGITRLRGRSYPFAHGVLIPTLHPAAALRGGAEPLGQMRADFVRAKLALADARTPR